jgi:Sec7-like guanine-nucleotide exchange factor
LKLPTVASKKYIKKYQQYKDYTSPIITPLIGCIYQGKTADKINVIGMLMEYGDNKSTIKNKHGNSYTILSNTLKAVLAV